MRSSYSEMMLWANEVMNKWVRQGGDQERLEKYFEELVDGADYSTLWDSLARTDKAKSRRR